MLQAIGIEEFKILMKMRAGDQMLFCQQPLGNAKLNEPNGPFVEPPKFCRAVKSFAITLQVSVDSSSGC